MSSTQDYIPKNPDTFHAFQGNYVSEVEENLPQWQISDVDIAPLKTQQAAWDIVYPAAAIPNNRTPADVLARQERQAEYTKVIRTFTNQHLANNPLVSNADKERLGLHIHSNSRHPAPDPTSSPTIIRIDTSERQQHTIHFADESGSRAKPAGVHSCEFFMKKGSPPATDAELVYVGIDTRSPFTINFDSSEVGQTVYYRLRWVNTRGVHGPWSEQWNAVIG
jgi:hypothetical protein